MPSGSQDGGSGAGGAGGSPTGDDATAKVGLALSPPPPPAERGGDDNGGLPPLSTLGVPPAIAWGAVCAG